MCHKIEDLLLNAIYVMLAHAFLVSWFTIKIWWHTHIYTHKNKYLDVIFLTLYKLHYPLIQYLQLFSFLLLRSNFRKYIYSSYKSQVDLNFWIHSLLYGGRLSIFQLPFTTITLFWKIFPSLVFRHSFFNVMEFLCFGQT